MHKSSMSAALLSVLLTHQSQLNSFKMPIVPHQQQINHNPRNNKRTKPKRKR